MVVSNLSQPEVALIVVGLVLAIGAWAVWTRGKKVEPDPVEKLLRERLGALEGILAQVGKEYRQGQADFGALHGATVAVLQAKLELTQAPEERAKLQEGLVEQARLRCEFLKEQQDAAATGVDALRAKVTFLDAKIALIRAQQQLQQTLESAKPQGHGK